MNDSLSRNDDMKKATLSVVSGYMWTQEQMYLLFEISRGYYILNQNVFVRFKDTGQIYPIAPVYVNPTAPRNTFSLSALKRFCGFPKVEETMLESYTLKDSNGETKTIPCYHHNGLD